MPDGSTNDNEPTAMAANGGDAHGRAAVLLVESLVHGLIARSVINVGDAVEIVGSAAEIEREITQAAGDTPSPIVSARVILATIEQSLKGDTSPELRPTS